MVAGQPSAGRTGGTVDTVPPALSDRLRSRGSGAIVAGSLGRDGQVPRADLDADVRNSELLLCDWDRTGRFWPAGLVDCVTASRATDGRQAFWEALPRSMTFGARLARLVAKAAGRTRCDPLAADLARLVNMFVTAFDGVCDETPELLPDLLPPLRKLFAGFPDPGSPASVDLAPSARLTLELARAAFRILAGKLAAAPAAEAEQLALAVERAVGLQVESLSLQAGSGEALRTVRQREALSAATITASLIMSNMFLSDDRLPLAAVEGLGEAAGGVFGLADDIVDFEQDARTGQPNTLAALLALEPPDQAHGESLAAIAGREMATRWQRVASAAAGLTCSEAVINELRDAALWWLGIDPSAARSVLSD